jgi:cyclic pyranopterin phosphate synthase
MPQDSYGRDIDYLRISLVDQCNLRCVYCMPLRGLSFLPSAQLLSAAEIERVGRAALAVGFRRFRLTGGEPTLRADLVDVVARLAALPGVEDLSMTTNALLLPRLAQPLRAAGLVRVNVHLDSLDARRLGALMRFSRLEDVWAGIEAAERAGLAPIKLNCVVTDGYNEQDVVELARLTLTRPWHVRFIELMPLGAGEAARVARQHLVRSVATRARIETALGALTPLAPTHPSDEARNHRLPGARGVVGFISPVSEPYCGSCNRLRLTADGRFHLCLLNDDELDVRAALRSGAGQAALEAILRRAVAFKPTGHRLDIGHSTERRSMYQIGG